jgi:PhnB protein
VFGAKLTDRTDGPNGTVAHAELDFGNGRLQLGDPAEAYQIAAPDPKTFATHPIGMYCPDVDDVVEGAERAGATIRDPRRPSSPRSLRINTGPLRPALDRDDPCRDLSPEERDRRLAEWAKEKVN